MTTAVQHRRGTTAEHATFTGLEGEVTIDTTKDTAVIHDGTLAGGYPLAKENLANVNPTTLSTIDGASTASDDKFLIWDQSALTLKSITRAELNNAMEADALANVSITGGTINGTSIGATTASSGAFTTLAASGDVTLSGGTANGVAYLNGSKVLTSGSALMFDGTSYLNFVGGGLYPIISVAPTGNNAIFGFRMDASAGNGRDWRIEQGRNAVGQFNITDITAGNTVRYSIGSDGTAIWNVGAGTGSEQMRLTSTGLGIGTSSPGAKLDVNGGIKSNSSVSITKAGSDTIASGPFFYVTSGGAGDGWVTQLGASNTYDWWNNTGGIWTKKATLDSAGNLGLGVTPSAWDSSYKAVRVNNFTLASQDQSGGGELSKNSFVASGGSNTYISDGFASKYEQLSGAHRWLTAPSGTAGNAISFTQAMTLDASGKLGIGTTSPAKKFAVSDAGGIGFEIAPNDIGNGINRLISYNRSTSAYVPVGIEGTEIYFSTGPNPIGEKARIDSSGNVGIGTSSPGFPLDVQCDGSAFGVRLRGRSSDNISVLRFVNNAASTTYAQFDVRSDGFLFNVVANNPLLFFTNNTERARIDSSGNLLVGTTSSWTTTRCQIDQSAVGNVLVLRNNTVANNSSLIVGVKAGSTNNTSQVYVEFTYNSGANGNGAIAGNGDSQCTFISRSDARLKENITELSSQLQNICNLRPVEFDYKDTGNRQIGFIAQDVQQIYPDLVSQNENGMLMLGGMDKTTARLVKAIQEQQTIINAQQAALDSLKARLDAANL